MRRRPIRAGTGIAATAVALAVATLWIGFGLHDTIRDEIQHLSLIHI